MAGERVYQALYPDWATSQAHGVEAVCQDECADVWVAERHGRPVEYVAVRVHAEDRTGEIEMMAVDPLVQRQGIGTALTRFAVQQLRDAGVRLAVVGTGGDPGHAAARRVYEKAGLSVCRWSGTTRGSTQTQATRRLDGHCSLGTLRYVRACRASSHPDVRMRQRFCESLAGGRGGSLPGFGVRRSGMTHNGSGAH